jgi:peptidyl-prolyl cis-trans isomerase SurA
MRWELIPRSKIVFCRGNLAAEPHAVRQILAKDHLRGPTLFKIVMTNSTVRFVKNARKLCVLGLYCFASSLLAVPVVATPALAAGEVLGIAAIVNDAVISRYDLDQRVRLVIVTSGIQPTPENVERIREQVLRSLVDEQLQLQEAGRIEIEVEDSEIDTSIDSIAQRAGMSRDQIVEYLSSNGVNEAALRTQILADSAWNKVIGARFAPLVTIGDDEIQEALARIAADANQVQYQLKELYLGFDNPAQEREMAVGAQRLVEQLRAGAPFSNVAQQFSQAASAANGGDIGWVSESQLAPEIAQAVRSMDVAAVSNPIRTVNGYYVMQLTSRRQGLGPNPLETRFSLIQVILPLRPDAPPAAAQARVTQIEKLQAEFRTCARLPQQAASIPGAQVSQPQSVTAAQLRGPIRAAVMSKEAGSFVPAGRTERGIEALVICDRKDDVGNQPTYDSIENNLFNQELSMMARRHLRDLRRDAVIEIR